MKRDLAAFLCHTDSNLRASLPHHLQVQDQSEQMKSSLKALKSLSAYLGEMPSDRSTAAWFSSEGVVLDLRVPSHTNDIVQANSHKKTFRPYQLSTAPCACS